MVQIETNQLRVTGHVSLRAHASLTCLSRSSSCEQSCAGSRSCRGTGLPQGKKRALPACAPPALTGLAKLVFPSARRRQVCRFRHQVARDGGWRRAALLRRTTLRSARRRHECTVVVETGRPRLRPMALAHISDECVVETPPASTCPRRSQLRVHCVYVAFGKPPP